MDNQQDPIIEKIIISARPGQGLPGLGGSHILPFTSGSRLHPPALLVPKTTPVYTGHPYPYPPSRLLRSYRPLDFLSSSQEG